MITNNPSGAAGGARQKAALLAAVTLGAGCATGGTMRTVEGSLDEPLVTLRPVGYAPGPEGST